jgi:xanthine dehydrogenase accessory factor
LDFRITIIDDREEYSTGLQLDPPVRVIHSPPDYSTIPEPGSNTYVCLVSKGYVTDEAALRRIIRSKAKYIGMIGSRKKVQTVYDHMEKDGFDKELFRRVHAPIGVQIQSDTPEEIAISILAEIIRIKNGDHHGH